MHRQLAGPGLGWAARARPRPDRAFAPSGLARHPPRPGGGGFRFREAIQSALKKAYPDRTYYNVLEDNDPSGFKSTKGMEAKAEVLRWTDDTYLG